MWEGSGFVPLMGAAAMPALVTYYFRHLQGCPSALKQSTAELSSQNILQFSEVAFPTSIASTPSIPQG